MNEKVMTGRELISYILANHLENEPVYENGKLLGFMTADEAAVKFNVGTATVRVWVNEGNLYGININGVLYIPANSERPGVKVNVADMVPTIPPLSLSPLLGTIGVRQK